MIIGGMPESVAKWIETHDFLQCQEVQDDILSGYEDDFPKYRKKVEPALLRLTMRSAAVQATKKFVYAEVGSGYKANEVKNALELLVPVLSSLWHIPMPTDFPLEVRRITLTARCYCWIVD